MTAGVEIRVNQATAAEIAAHLVRCDQAFVPRLSERVEIDDYARKIAERAERFEGWSHGALVGLVAAYCSDDEIGSAYITNVSVVPEYRHRGIASLLLAECVDFAHRQQLGRISLDVDRENVPAVVLYEAKGFSVASVSGQTIRMDLYTGEDVHMGNQS